MIKLSLVVPFYNEEKIIAQTYYVLVNYLKRNYPENFELIFVNDGSKDNSLGILKNEIDKSPNLKLITYKQNQGRGYAVTQGFKKAKGEVIGFIDSDLEINSKYIKKCIDKIDQFDVTMISKNLPDSQVKTTLIRKLSSKIFTIWVGMFLGSNLADHQGGLKLFKKKVVKKVLGKVTEKGWLFDLEILYHCQKNGFRVGKVPINIEYGLNGLRLSLLTDFLKSLILVLKLRFKNDK